MGGIINAADPTLIPDNACVEMENYEYQDGQYPKKRYGVDTSEINTLGLTGVRAIAVWNPRLFPSGCTGDRIYIVANSTYIRVIYKSGLTFINYPVFTGLDPNSTLNLFVSQERVIISDTANNGRYIFIDADLVIKSGTIGIDSPRYMPSVSLAGADNSYASVAESDTGMSIERGNVLQYCYTVEDKYGVESNPSPIHTCYKLAFKHLDVAPPGYKYYWYQAKITGLSISQYDSVKKKELKYYNLYRRDIDFREGVISKQFVLVKKVPVTNTTPITVMDNSNQNYADIGYDRNVAPKASLMVEKSGVIYMAGTISPFIVFPFVFDKYVELSLVNNNDQDYVRPIVTVKITPTMCGVAALEPYIANLSKIRLFFSDMLTPIPVMYSAQLSGGVITELDCIIAIPYLNRNSETKLYLCLATTATGVTDATWDSYAYGKFFDYDVDPWANQIIFDINRPTNLNHHLCVNVPYALAVTDSRAVMFNLANQTKLGHIYNASNSSKKYIDNDTLMYLSPYGDNKNINNMSYAIDKNHYVKYDLIKTPKLPAVIYFDGYDCPCGWETGYMPCQALLQCGTFFVALVHRDSVNKVTAYLKIGTSLWGELFAIPCLTEQWTRIRLRLFLHITSTKLYYRYWGYAYDGTAEVVTGDGHKALGVSFSIENVFYLNKDISSHITSTDKYYDITRLDFVETQILTDDEIELLGDSYWRGITYFRAPLGATLLDTFANENITSEIKTITTETNKKMLVWSDITGNSFPTLNSKLFREEIRAIDIVPSYMRMQYQNTLIVLTRNTVSRVILSDDLQSLATAINNEIEEFSSGGLFAPQSYTSGGGHLFWLSESGVIMYGADGMVSISFGIINIPIHENYIGMWIDRYSQYILHDKTNSISYVYHVNHKAWTIFTGLDISLVARIPFGEDILNKILIVTSTGAIREYPGTTIDTTCTHKITTKRFMIGNQRVSRYRLIHDITTGTRSITAKTYNHFLSATELSIATANPPRYEWIMLPINFWGEYLQFYIDNLDAITSIDIDIKEGV